MADHGPLKLVPFNSTWIQHDKMDLKAIYRRPRYKQDEFGEYEREYDQDGNQMWDLTGPLPVKQHVRWTAKGFEYVTLADRVSLAIAGQHGTVLNDSGEPTSDWRQYDQHQTGGPWNYKKYAAGQTGALHRAAQELLDDIAEYGWETVEKLRRRTEPGFRIPDHLKRAAASTKDQPTPQVVKAAKPPKTAEAEAAGGVR